MFVPIDLLKPILGELTEKGRVTGAARPWLGLSTEDLTSRMLDPGILAREMRQVSPFAGLLEPQDRVRILKRFRKEYRS